MDLNLIEKQCYFDSFKINRDTKYKTTTTNKWL